MRLLDERLERLHKLETICRAELLQSCLQVHDRLAQRLNEGFSFGVMIARITLSVNRHDDVARGVQRVAARRS